MPDGTLTVHGTCVDIAGKGVLITGPSGSGKSSLALQLMAIGARLVSDDRTILSARHGRVQCTPPQAIAGKIEARGVGILTVDYLEHSVLALVIDMGQREEARLPMRHSVTLLDITLPCLHKVDAAYFPAAINAYLTANSIEVS